MFFFSFETYFKWVLFKIADLIRNHSKHISLKFFQQINLQMTGMINV